MTSQNVNCLPSRFTGAMFRWLSQRGYPAHVLLKSTQISEDLLRLSQAKITLSQHIQFIRNVLEVTKNPHLGLEFGKKFWVNIFGIVGHAALNCRTLREALQLICQNQRLFATTVSIEVTYVNDNMVASIFDAEECEIIKEFRMECFISAANQILVEATLVDEPPLAAKVTYPKPLTWEGISSQLSFSIEFEQCSNQLIFPAEFLDYPLPNYDPAVNQLINNACMEQKRNENKTFSIVDYIKRIVINNPGDAISLSSVASKLHSSPRTMRRELSKLGTSFSSIVEQQKKELAINYLQRRNTSIEVIANQLGYQDTSSFARAFKRWTGVSPGSYRSRAYVSIENQNSKALQLNPNYLL